MKQLSIAAALLVTAGVGLAKLPPPDDATKAKAAETSAKAAWQAKVDMFQLCKAQDRVAAQYAKTAGKPGAAASGVKTVATAAAAAKPASGPASAAAKPASGASGASASNTAAPAAAAASSTSTPVASSAPPPCADPGPFAYNPPEQKPLETSGAHSPAGTAASPPSVRAESGQMAPAKK